MKTFKYKNVKGKGFIKNLKSKISIICQAASSGEPAPPDEDSDDQDGTNGKADSSLIQDLIKDIESQKDDFSVQTENNQALVSEEEGGRLIVLTAKEKKITKQQAILAIGIICQKGGTSKNAKGDIYARIDNIKITLADLREIKKKYGLKFTLRQWARTFASYVHTVCSLFSIQGDLAKILARKDSSLSDDDLIWCSNFQMDNPDCPEHIRAKIKEHFDDLFKKK